MREEWRERLGRSADLEVLSPHTKAAHEAERAGDWTAYENALRPHQRTARREALRERKVA